MIDKGKLWEFVEKELDGSENYLVDVRVSPANEIVVEIDNDHGVDIDDCIALTRAIEGAFDRDEEDYELEVGSSGLTSPFKTLRQYKKFIGNNVDVITKGGKKLRGVLKEADESGFVIGVDEKVKREGEKRPHLEEVDYRFGYDEVKSTVYALEI
ncbi:MAG: ribosome assembly cofactor RimP [Muribaculaceae bacterium]|nr:ribosome assembly cofactor RimP [Muribaculaceae bacterium]